MNKIILLFILICSTVVFSQKEKLVVHRTHSSDIQLLEFSYSGKYLASLGSNSELIIWHVKLNRLLTSFYIDDFEEIVNMSFSKDEKYLFVKTKRTIFSFNIAKSKLIDAGVIDLRTNRDKTYYLDKDKKTEYTISNGNIIKKLSNKKIPLLKLRPIAIETKFTSLDVSPDQKMLIVGGDDGNVYVYKYGFGVKIKTLYTGHVSAVYDVKFTEDGKYFASAGRDRSILIRKTADFEEESRITSKIFRKNTVQFSENGDQIYVGDESGYIYEIDLGGNFPKINVQQVSNHPVNKIRYNKKKKNYFITTSNNEVQQRQSPISSKIIKRYKYKQYPIVNSKAILFQKLGIYQPPFGKVKAIKFSPDSDKMIYTGDSENPNITYYDFKTKKTFKLYKENNWDNLNAIGFLNDSTIIANSRNKKILYFWQKSGDEFYYKTDTLPFEINDFVVNSPSEIIINTSIFGLYKYNTYARSYAKIINTNNKRISLFKDNIVFIDYSNSIVFYNQRENKKYFSFKGHTDFVTDISFHPKNNTFVSSSYDGTIKLWDFDKKELIATIIPFKNQDFIFITKDNYYLISKGAINDFGFKYKNDYFYPDLFDLKYNRPDKVLETLNMSVPELIAAYKKAHERRIKKLNLTEGQLGIGSEFHLPETEIMNLLEIPSRTSSKDLLVKIKGEDSKYNIEKINVWVNGVAVFGSKGYDISKENSKQIIKNLTIPLAYGNNKIELNVLNSSGTQSFKKTIKILNTTPEIEPDLYLVSIGVSKFKDDKFNLNYAAKDARDVSTLFKESKRFKNIHVKEYTDEQVTKENLILAKDFLQKAKINDIVIVFIAGHGVLDENFNYYFASHDMDFQDPKNLGIPYELIENLVDNLRALRKLLFIDTCHSGELEKDEIEKSDSPIESEKEKDIKFRSAGINVKSKDNLGLQNTNELMKSSFNDMRKGTGATIISSSGGTEFAIEGEQWKNGLFTYCLLKGLTEKEADGNNDKKINIIELQTYIQQEVKRISKGSQTPTSRIANTQLNYNIW